MPRRKPSSKRPLDVSSDVDFSVVANHLQQSSKVKALTNVQPITNAFTAVHFILRFVGLTDIGQRALTGAVSHAVREAAVHSVMLGRRAHRQSQRILLGKIVAQNVLLIKYILLLF